MMHSVVQAREGLCLFQVLLMQVVLRSHLLCTGIA